MKKRMVAFNTIEPVAVDFAISLPYSAIMEHKPGKDKKPVGGRLSFVFVAYRSDVKGGQFYLMPPIRFWQIITYQKPKWL
jgi:hypothetical protein